MTTSARVAIVMSRGPRLVAAEAPWLGALLACLRRIERTGQTLLVSPGTAASDFILRGAVRFRLPTQCVSPDAALNSLDRDRLLIREANEVLVLGIRPHGNIQQLLMERLQAGRAGVVLIDRPHLQSDALRRELVALGATLWSPAPAEMAPLPNATAIHATTALLADPQPSLLTLAALPTAEKETFLTHTTRACPGPWPEQSLDEYLDHLLEAHPDAEHSPLNTLLRIVGQRRLIASSRTIRGGYPMVSFTAVPLHELPTLRHFSKHRYRWDFEPYAISIRRDVLVSAGAQPVIYGDETRWADLNAAQRPYFQLHHPHKQEAAPGPHRDWTLEQEWRHPGDLNLADLPHTSVMVLVPDTAAARKIQPHSPWPLTLWPGEISR